LSRVRTSKSTVRKTPLAVVALALLSCRPRASEEKTPPDASAVRAAPIVVPTAVALPIRLAEPIELWRDKKPIKSSDVVLLKVTVSNSLEFMPMNIADPLVVLDDWTCLPLKSPLASGELVVLAPRLSSRALLWVSPRGVTAETMSATDAQRYRAEAEGWGRALATVEPPGGAPESVHDVAELRARLNGR
jgi:hypothetical protein